MSQATPRFESQVCFALYRASRLVIQSYHESLSRLDLTYLQYMVLMLLSEAPDLSLKEVGEKLTLDSGTLSPLIKKLEARGLVVRSPDPSDERSIRVRLTTKGKALERQSCKLGEELGHKLNSTPAQIKEFRDGLNALSNQLHIQNQKPNAPQRKEKSK